MAYNFIMKFNASSIASEYLKLYGIYKHCGMATS